jgi:hypothetical protein
MKGVNVFEVCNQKVYFLKPTAAVFAVDLSLYMMECIYNTRQQFTTFLNS